MAAAAPRATEPSVIAFRQKCDAYLQMLDSYRWSWWQNWRSLARYISPRLARFLETPNEGTRGRAKNQWIVDNVGSIASQRFGAGLMAGSCSPARPWYQIEVGSDKAGEGSPARLWADEVVKRQRKIFQESNFYRSIADAFEQIGVFGTAVVIIYEDYEDVIRCFPVATGEYYLANDHRLDASTLGRRFAMTAEAMVGEFSYDQVSDACRTSYDQGQLGQEFMVAHLIMPNDPKVWGQLGLDGFKYIEAFWEWGSGSNTIMRIKGFHEKPFIAARWNVTANDPYGRSPGMDALGDIKQLQQMQLRLGMAIDKMVNPPLVGPPSLRNQPATVLPGTITYTAEPAAFKSVYDVRIDLEHMQLLIERVEARIKSTFFEDLFLMISQLDDVRSATEIVERKEEKMLMLGPALERLHDEFLRPAVERVFAIMMRARLVPPAPAEIQGKPITIEFISTLAQAQRAAATVAIERLFAFVGNLSAVFPQVVDKVDVDEAIDEYADALGAPPRIVVSADKVAALRAARAKQQQGVAALQAGQAAAATGKVLADTEVGGGQTALGKITGLAA